MFREFTEQEMAGQVKEGILPKIEIVIPGKQQIVEMHFKGN